MDVGVGLDLDSEPVHVDFNVITFGARLEEKLVVFRDLPIPDVEPDSVEANLRIAPDEIVHVALSIELSVLSLLEEGNDLLSCLVLDFPLTELFLNFLDFVLEEFYLRLVFRCKVGDLRLFKNISTDVGHAE